MIGVVLWSDRDCGKAVFWCEDQGNLAYFETSKSTTDSLPVPQFEAGDMVQFSVRNERRLRTAHDVRLLQESAAPDLPSALREKDDLRQAVAVEECAPQTAHIIPFVPRPNIGVRLRDRRKA